MRYPKKTVTYVDKPIELEKITPVYIEKPLENGSESSNNHKQIDDGLQELSAGYTTDEAHKKA